MIYHAVYLDPNCNIVDFKGPTKIDGWDSCEQFHKNNKCKTPFLFVNVQRNRASCLNYVVFFVYKKPVRKKYKYPIRDNISTEDGCFKADGDHGYWDNDDPKLTTIKTTIEKLCLQVCRSRLSDGPSGSVNFDKVLPQCTFRQCGRFCKRSQKVGPIRRFQHYPVTIVFPQPPIRHSTKIAHTWQKNGKHIGWCRKPPYKRRRYSAHNWTRRKRAH